MPEGLPTTRPCGGGASSLEAGRPRERSCVDKRSCVEAVMDYLDGPLTANFDFMFDEE